MTRNPATAQGGATLPWVRGLAWTAVGLTIVLITVGGLVTNTDSGLACPDWPTCFGTPFPRLVGGVLMEHGHRYLATALGFLAVLLVIGTHLKKPASMVTSLLVSMPLILIGGVWAGMEKHKSGAVPTLAGLLVLAGYVVGLISSYRARGAARHAEASLLLVITQGLLGGATVMYQLPVTVLILHLATSMLFLAVLVWLAVRLEPASLEINSNHFINSSDSRSRASNSPVSSPNGSGPKGSSSSASGSSGNGLSLARFWLPIATLAVYLQIVLGASVRHTGAGLVCTGWLCKGAIWPTGVHPAVHLHMAHRAFALVAGTLAAYVALRVRRDALHANDRRAAALGAAIPILVLVQISLGIATLWTLKEIWAVTAHLFVAALLLAACSYLWARAANPFSIVEPS